MFRKDPFGNSYFLKRTLILVLGFFTWFRYRKFNNLEVTGMEHLQELSPNKVLFVSNHQTYFAEVILMYHLFAAHNNGLVNKLTFPWYLLRPKANLFFVAAVETMKSGFIPKLFAYAGSISIKRTWREAGKNVNRKVDFKDIANIGVALDEGWVITFPQGTTTPYVQGRRGTAHIIKRFEPVVIPVVIDGFRRAFDKRGLFLKKTNTTLKIHFKAPMDLTYQEEADELVDKLMHAIEQRPIPESVADFK